MQSNEDQESLESAIRDTETLCNAIVALRDDQPLPEVSDDVLLLADNLYCDLKPAIRGEVKMPKDDLSTIWYDVMAILSGLRHELRQLRSENE